MQANSVTALTAPDRLALLLPWLNRDGVSSQDACAAVSAFLALPVGGDHLGVRQADAVKLAARTVSSRQLTGLRETLRTLLGDSVSVRSGRSRAWPSKRWTLKLNFAAFSAAKTRPAPPEPWQKAPRLKAGERRDYLGPGAYGLAVGGSLADVLVYGVMRTLTEPGAVALAQCPAPAAGDTGERCGRWLVSVGRRRGRPATYCSDTCRVRAHRKEKE